MLAREVLEILIEPHSPVAACRDFVALKVQELVGWHVLRQLVATLGHEHGWENEAVEHDVVLANEVDDAGVGGLPVFLPVVGPELLGVADVANGGIKPHIQHLALGALDGHGDAPVEVAGDSTWLKASVEPRLALAVDIGLPLLVVLKNPLAQLGLPLVERHVPVLSLLEYGHIASDGAAWIDEVGGVERCAASLALVAIGTFTAAVGASAGDVAVGKPLVGLFVVELLAHLLDKLALVVEFLEEIAGGVAVHLTGGATIHVKRDAQPCHRLLDNIVIAVNYILWCNTFLLCLNGNGHAVLVAATYHEHILTL